MQLVGIKILASKAQVESKRTNYICTTREAPVPCILPTQMLCETENFAGLYFNHIGCA